MYIVVYLLIALIFTPYISAMNLSLNQLLLLNFLSQISSDTLNQNHSSSSELSVKNHIEKSKKNYQTKFRNQPKSNKHSFKQTR